jgi:hypothetical protein
MYQGQGNRRMANEIGHCGQADIHTFAGEAFRPSVQRLVLSELFKGHDSDHAGTGPIVWDGMERCLRLADLFARPAGEFLLDGLDGFPLARNDFQRLLYHHNLRKLRAVFKQPGLVPSPPIPKLNGQNSIPTRQLRLQMTFLNDLQPFFVRPMTTPSFGHLNALLAGGGVVLLMTATPTKPDINK